MTSEGLFALLLAPFIGSFIGVVADRLPRGEPLVLGRSRCDHCGHQLGPMELVPLLSYLLQGGRCRHCGGRLRPFYLTIEMTTVLVALSAALVLEGWLLWMSLGLGACLLTLAVIDLHHLVLPDIITLLLIPIGLAIAWGIRPDAIDAHLIGAVLGFATFATIAWLYRRVRKRDGLGLGDAKLLAAAGAWLGWQALPGVVLLAALAALVVALAGTAFGDRLKTTSEIAFGPYLALAFWTSWLFGPIVLA